MQAGREERGRGRGRASNDAAVWLRTYGGRIVHDPRQRTRRRGSEERKRIKKSFAGQEAAALVMNNSDDEFVHGKNVGRGHRSLYEGVREVGR